MNQQPYSTPPQWWEPRLSPRLVRLTRGYRRRQLHRKQKIVDIQVEGKEHLLTAIQSNQGVLITPNHSAHYDSAALYIAADQCKTPLFFMTAWQVFGMSPLWERHLMQRLGCFSIDRENADRKAYKQSVQILQGESIPLVIFPEGDIFHVTDHVTPFREGAAAIAISAARRADRPVVVVPCGIKFTYVEDPMPRLEKLMTELEERLLLRPEPNRAMRTRIYRFADALVALKEVDYLGATLSGTLRERIASLTESILVEMEARHELRSREATAIPERVKELRKRVIVKLEQVSDKNYDQTHVDGLMRDMQDLFFAMQLYSYPGDYLIEDASVERLAETLDKFEEDVLQREIPSVHGRRRVTVRFGPALDVSSHAQGRDGVATLTKEMRAAVQTLINEINGVSTINPSNDRAAAQPSQVHGRTRFTDAVEKA